MDSRSLSLTLLVSLGLFTVLMSLHSEASLVKKAVKTGIPNGDDDEKFILPDGNKFRLIVIDKLVSVF